MPATAQSPAWAGSLFDKMTRGWGSQLRSQEEVVVEPRESVQCKHVDVTVVMKDDGTIIFQIFPKSRKWPSPEAARDFLAEVIEAHYGDTDRFSADYVHELKSWAIRAVGLPSLINYDKAFHIDGFIALVDDSVDAL